MNVLNLWRSRILNKYALKYLFIRVILRGIDKVQPSMCPNLHIDLYLHREALEIINSAWISFALNFKIKKNNMTKIHLHIYESPFPSVREVVSDILEHSDFAEHGVIHILGRFNVGYNIKELWNKIPENVQKMKVREYTSIGAQYYVDYFIEARTLKQKKNNKNIEM